MSHAPSTETILKKPNVAVVMAPKVGKMTTTGRKVFNSLLYHAQQELVDLKARGLPHQSKDLFRYRLCDLLRPINIDPDTNTAHLRKYIKEMQSSQVEWSSPDAKAEILWMSMVLISSAYITKEKGFNWLYWSFPPPIIESLYDLERFTVIKLEELSKLNSYAAVALYEICARYADNPSHCTSINEPTWWVIALSSEAQKKSTDGQSPKVRLWKSFKLERVLPAINEINEKTNLVIELVEARIGLKITSVQFRVNRKARPREAELESSSKPLVGNDEIQMMTKAVHLGLPESIVSDLIGRGYSIEQIGLFLERFSVRLHRDDLDQVGNKKRFFDKMVESNDLVFPSIPSSHDLIIESNIPDILTLADDLQIKLPKPSIAPKPIDVTIVDEFSETFSALSEEVKTKYLSELAVHLKARGLLTPMTHRKIISGEWQSPGILHQLKSFFNLAQRSSAQ